MDQQELFNGTNNKDDIQELSKHSNLELKKNSGNVYINGNPHDHLINTLGVSKKLGSSVLNELDSRTNAKFEQLFVSNDDHTESLMDLTFSERFNIAHNSQFKTMESLNSHYCVKFLNPNNNDDNVIDGNIYKTPLKKNLQTEQLQSNSIKRLKTTQNLLSTPPPILDITRRIRRLRLRNSLSNNNNNNNNSTVNTSSNGGNSRSGYGLRSNHDSRSIVNSKIKNTPITKPQKPLEPPSFLRPTITSLNKMKRSDKMNDINSKIRPQKIRMQIVSNNTTATMYSSFQNKDKKIFGEEKSGRRVKSTGNTISNSSESLSVFERLYKQSTVSRSVSMNNVTSNKTIKKHEDMDENNNKIIGKNSNGSNSSTIQFGRSKTTSGLSDHITTNKNCNISLKTRPAWR
ncbi:She1p PWA37_003801 [Arxiozyma heterogenica]|uniref:Uncharacterized protein n=1 Tax=Arxiozyma heterogenica TaxID=278026 RepID=A0AAN7ZWW0_9SACH|nr:hypothetical protein RI543_004907 [Kazachstania heterogenica]